MRRHEACTEDPADVSGEAGREVGDARRCAGGRVSLMKRNPLRWFAISVFMIASMLNYLDRSLLAALAPTIEAKFHFDDAQYGWLLSGFAILYALMAPLAGIFIDWAGLNIGAAIAV